MLGGVLAARAVGDRVAAQHGLQRVGLEHEAQPRDEIGIEPVERGERVLGNVIRDSPAIPSARRSSVPLQVAGEAAELVEHQQHAEHAEHERGADDDRGVVPLHPAERAARRGRARARSTRNGRPSPIEYAASSVPPAHTRCCVAAMPRIEPRIGPMHGDQPKPNAAPATSGIADAVAAELGMESLLLVQPRRAQEQRAEEEQRHREHDRARDPREQLLVVAQRLPDARRR